MPARFRRGRIVPEKRHTPTGWDHLFQKKIRLKYQTGLRGVGKPGIRRSRASSGSHASDGHESSNLNSQRQPPFF